MDVLNLASAHLNNNPALRGTMETMVGCVFVLIVLFLEVQRRTDRADDPQDARSGGTFDSFKSLLRHCAPELVGTVVVGILSVAIRLRGDRTIVDEGVDDVWSLIKNEWPILITADTLLSLQAMVRLIITVSVVLRTGEASTGPVPLMKEPAVFLGLATCARVAVIVRTSHYMLDGPFGGTLPVACELAVLPLLVLLGLGAAKKTLLSSFMAAGVAVWFASRNRLSLADDFHADTLFMLAHTLELATGFAYLARTLHIVCDHAQSPASAAQAGLVHVLMVLQQAMPAYYFVVAFPYTPELVATGHPFEVLQYGNIGCLGAFLAALALHAAVAETDKGATNAPVFAAAAM